MQKCLLRYFKNSIQTIICLYMYLYGYVVRPCSSFIQLTVTLNMFNACQKVTTLLHMIRSVRENKMKVSPPKTKAELSEFINIFQPISLKHWA